MHRARTPDDSSTNTFHYVRFGWQPRATQQEIQVSQEVWRLKPIEDSLTVLIDIPEGQICGVVRFGQ